MNQKNLLVISDGFPDLNHYNVNFVKNYVDLVKSEFNQINVISPQPFFPKLLSKIKLFQNFTRFSCYEDYNYENVKVYYPSFLMLPIKRHRQKRGEFFTKKCNEIIQKHNLEFDFIHTHFLFPSSYTGIELKKNYRKPLIATTHGSDIYVDPFISKANLKRTKQIIQNTDLVTVPSVFMSNKVQEINPQTKSKTKLVPNFIDTDFFKPNKKKQDKVKKILMVGNLIESKKVLDVIPTVLELLKIRKDFVVQIIGEGPLKSTLEKQVEKNKLKQYIKILGAKKNKALVKYYNQADTFFFPSKAESFGIVQIEALACEVPVVAGPNEGSKFVLKNYCGYISKSFRPNEFANLLNKSLNKKWNQQKMRNYIVNNFSNQKTKTIMLKIYQSLER